jgi:hypothetical protein
MAWYLILLYLLTFFSFRRCQYLDYVALNGRVFGELERIRKDEVIV